MPAIGDAFAELEMQPKLPARSNLGRNVDFATRQASKKAGKDKVERPVRWIDVVPKGTGVWHIERDLAVQVSRLSFTA